MNLPTYFISHGGGPWPYMDDLRRAMHNLEMSLVDIPRQLSVRPKAILMISAHWEENSFNVMGNPWPGMVYDYSSFPEHTYKIHYPAPGSPALAERVTGLIKAAGLPARIDAQRGFDHGAFAPLAVMYPEADMPVVQLSLRTGLDPAEHLALGRALTPLRAEGVLIIGSGLSYHNLRRFGPLGKEPSSSFDDWLQDSLIATSTGERVNRLIHWVDAPAARVAHPREDHLLPLMVAVGAAEDEVASCIYHEENIFGGVVASSFRFGAIG